MMSQKILKIFLFVPFLITLVLIIHLIYQNLLHDKAKKCLNNLNKPQANLLNLTNPSALFCTCMGGKYEIIKTFQGEDGNCKIANNNYNAWEYFRTFGK